MIARADRLDEALRGFEREAGRMGVSESLIDYALAAAKRRFADEAPSALLEGRVRAYAFGVVRRKSVRESGSRGLAARYVVWSLAADLRDSGRSASEIYDELERDWAHAVPGTVLDELRERLCA